MSHADRPDPDSLVLDNGQAAATAEQVLAALESLGIEHTTTVHRALYTVEDAKAVRYEQPGAHTKNLFLRNKKGRMFLLVIEQDRTVDLRALREQLALPGGQLAFASTERMERYLGVVPGSVTPLAVFNDHAGKVQVIIESALLESDWIYVHPCRNTHTTRIRTKALVECLQAWNHEPIMLPF
ncbi:MAG: prolyl-tRNA synthetase associated domain-containing protein [Granulosicoccaceae bacterium]